MPHQATLEYSEPLLRQAVLAFWRRTVGLALPAALVVATGSLGVLVMQGDTSWVVGALATFLALVLAFIAAIYFVHLRNAMRKLRHMGSMQAVFLAEESSFTVTSKLASSTVVWAAITEVWRFPTFWLLFVSKARFLTLPLAGMSPEMQAFVLQRIQAAGGKAC